MNAEALKAPYEGPLTADIEPPIAGAVDRPGTARVLTASLNVPSGELQEADYAIVRVWSDQSTWPRRA